MESIDPACTKLKHQYDQCFNQWYSDHFLKGDTKETCKDIFQLYQTCVEKALQTENLKKQLTEAQKENQAFFKSFPFSSSTSSSSTNTTSPSTTTTTTHGTSTSS